MSDSTSEVDPNTVVPSTTFDDHGKKGQQHYEIQPDPETMSKPKAPANASMIKPARTARLPAPPPKQPEEDPFVQAFAKMIDRHIESGNDWAIRTIDFMQKYVDDMAPGKKIDEDKGAAEQYRFFRNLRNLIDKAPIEDFRKCFNIVLAFFLRYKNEALNERFVNRFAEYWPRGDENLTTYQTLVNLLLVASDPEQRPTIARRVDIAKTLAKGYTEEGRANVITFFAI